MTPAQRSHPDSLKVMCVPMREGSDELAALMTAQVLEGLHVRAFDGMEIIFSILWSVRSKRFMIFDGI